VKNVISGTITGSKEKSMNRYTKPNKHQYFEGLPWHLSQIGAGDQDVFALMRDSHVLVFLGDSG